MCLDMQAAQFASPPEWMTVIQSLRDDNKKITENIAEKITKNGATAPPSKEQAEVIDDEGEWSFVRPHLVLLRE